MAGIPNDIVIRDLNPKTIKVPNPPTGQPVIATKAELRDGTRPTEVVTPAGTLIFEELFDGQPDWDASSLIANSFGVPPGWTVGRSDSLWGPGGTDPTPGKHPTAEILAANADKTRSGTGKSYVMWRESYDPGWNKFNSDALLMKVIGNQPEVYMEWWVTFSDEMIAGYYLGGVGQSKMVRILHIDTAAAEVNPDVYFEFFGDTNSPKCMVDFSGGTTYGIRNFVSLYARGDNNITAEVAGIPSGFQLAGGGDLSLSYSQAGMAGASPDGGTPQLTDYKNGGIIPDGSVNMDQVFGAQGQWIKMGLYAKINSAPGVADGEMMQWVDGKRVSHIYQIPWVRADMDMAQWNTIGIGGNDFFRLYPNADKYQDWYAIDDLRVYNGIPEGVEH